jgi:hypothetical protein
MNNTYRPPPPISRRPALKTGWMVISRSLKTDKHKIIANNNIAYKVIRIKCFIAHICHYVKNFINREQVKLKRCAGGVFWKYLSRL